MELFVYGTLMVPEVMRGVCGYADGGTPGRLHGYRCRLVRGEVYPAIVPLVGDQVSGLLYRGVTLRQLQLLDAFEGDLYERRRVSVTLRRKVVPAETYVLHADHLGLLSDRPWSFEAFRSDGISRFIDEYHGFDRVAPTPQDHD